MAEYIERASAVHTKKFPVGTMVSLANYAGTCRQYIGWLVNEASKENGGG